MRRDGFHRRVARVALAVAVAACAPMDDDLLAKEAAAAVSTSLDRVTIDDGELVGTLDGRTYLFAGIPYAMPPVGPRRFQRPTPNLPWTTPHDATRFAPRCVDTARSLRAGESLPAESEDCLYLNVWTPTPKSSAPMPVMVWLGGGSRSGVPTTPALLGHYDVLIENGRALADRGVVVVTVEARRGPFGHFVHPALDAEGHGGGNQRLYDQQRALTWVQQNIARFGGDPRAVTLFGQDAGAVDACLHIVAPSSRGLFERVIGQSGSCTGYLSERPKGEAEALRLATKLSCASTGADALACLRQRPAAALAEDYPFADDPIVDGAFIPEQPRVLFQKGEIAKVDLILGNARDEAVFIARPTPPSNLLPAILRHRFGPETGDVVAAHYARLDPVSETRGLYSLVRIYSDAFGICASYEMALLAKQAGARAWSYLFDVPRTADPSMHPIQAAAMGDDVPYVFGSVATEAPTVAQSMQTLWTNFAKRGDPNFAAAPTSRTDTPPWPELTADGNTRMVFAPPSAGGVHAEFEAAARDCAIWLERYATLFAERISLASRP